jgi:hypothetical protein
MSGRPSPGTDFAQSLGAAADLAAAAVSGELPLAMKRAALKLGFVVAKNTAAKLRSAWQGRRRNRRPSK